MYYLQAPTFTYICKKKTSYSWKTVIAGQLPIFPQLPLFPSLFYFIKNSICQDFLPCGFLMGSVFFQTFQDNQWKYW